MQNEPTIMQSSNHRASINVSEITEVREVLENSGTYHDSMR